MSGDGLRALPDGRWLLSRTGRRYLLPGDLGRSLARGEATDLDVVLDERGCPGRRTRRSLRFRRVVLIQEVVVAVAERMSFAAAWPVMIVMSVLGGAALVRLGIAGISGGVDVIAAGLVVALAALAHEFGHAAALSRGGGRPGPIGVGLMLILPVLWCDVTEAGLLSRRDRVRVDLAGVAWQLGIAGVVATALSFTAAPTATAIAKAVLATVVWSLLPLMKTDGAWVLADLVGLSHLEAKSSADATRSRRRASAAARILAGLSILGIAGASSWRMRGFATLMFAQPRPLAVLLGMVSLLVLIAAAVSLGRRLGGLWRLAVADWKECGEP